jgi:hypothetical protein
MVAAAGVQRTPAHALYGIEFGALGGKRHRRNDRVSLGTAEDRVDAIEIDHGGDPPGHWADRALLEVGVAALAALALV